MSLFEDDEQEREEYVDYLIEIGILEEDGFDEDGSMTYTYNFPLMKETDPELYEHVMSGINEGLMDLFTAGYIEINYDENLVAHFKATPEGMEYFDKIIPKEE